MKEEKGKRGRGGWESDGREEERWIGGEGWRSKGGNEQGRRMLGSRIRG